MDMITFNEVPPAINQIETHPFNQQIETQQFLIENGVQIESWGPFAEGRNILFRMNYSWLLLPNTKEAWRRWYPLAHPKGIVAIPKSVKTERIKENFNVFDFEIREEDMTAIAALDLKPAAF